MCYFLSGQKTSLAQKFSKAIDPDTKPLACLKIEIWTLCVSMCVWPGLSPCSALPLGTLEELLVINM